MKTRSLSSAFALFLFASPLVLAGAAHTNDSPAGQRLTPEQALNLRRISDLGFSPDGARLAFTVSEPPKGTDNPRHIWIMDVATHQVRQYTFSGKSDDSPRWSPDGKFLAFLSNRDEFRQIYLMPSNGGDAYAITEGKRNIGSLEWSPDGKQIAFVAADAPTDAEEKKEKDKDDAIVVDHDDKHSRIWLFDVATKKSRALTAANWEVREAEWTPQSNSLIVVATDHPESDDDTDRIFSVNLTDGNFSPIFAPKGPFGDIRVAPDGKQFAYIGSRVDGPEPHDLYIRSLDAQPEQPSRNLTSASLDRPTNGIEWQRNGSLAAVVEKGFKTALYSINVDGSAKIISNADPNPHSFAIAPSGTVAFVGESATTPPEIYLASGNSSAERVTHLNSTWDSVILSKPSFFHYRSFDGLEIEGELLKPLDYTGNGAMPTVILVHGGPTGAWSDNIDSWGQLLATHGFAVAYFNIRGSTGYGEKFVEMNRADWGGADFKDVMAGVDYLVKQGIADP
ncbi:MAG TPA: prolyl oligopeptidase family serine peptidase, partial [Candidatus Acidoferrales bacterium]|nr:prolyl oligopeptidase family serine peptidase [Candidatus Acidoferrales bacterium]